MYADGRRVPRTPDSATRDHLAGQVQIRPKQSPVDPRVLRSAAFTPTTGMHPPVVPGRHFFLQPPPGPSYPGFRCGPAARPARSVRERRRSAGSRRRRAPVPRGSGTARTTDPFAQHRDRNRGPDGIEIGERSAKSPCRSVRTLDDAGATVLVGLGQLRRIADVASSPLTAKALDLGDHPDAGQPQAAVASGRRDLRGRLDRRACR